MIVIGPAVLTTPFGFLVSDPILLQIVNINLIVNGVGINLINAIHIAMLSLCYFKDSVMFSCEIK